MFSTRLPPNPRPNALSHRLQEMRATGVPYVDLTESNPTRVGLDYPPDLLAPLADPQGLRYSPHPFGLKCARAAIADDYARRGASIDPANVVLSASTSESYSWLFKMLCNPGERILVPRPSYPLFEHLARLEGVHADTYDLEYHGRWEIDIAGLEWAVRTETRAVLLVSPNNPTGSFVKRPEIDAIFRICKAHGLALIADEVFADYALDQPADAVTEIAARAPGLAFTLGGFSKSLGLPQLKLGWIVVGGPADVRMAALDGLELVADNYLSVATPVQVGASALLSRGAAVRQQIQARVRDNFRALQQVATGHPSCEVLATEGGWYAVVRVPASVGEEERVLGLLEQERVLVHPGYFFDFAREAYLVLSLLPAPAVFLDAASRVLTAVS